MKRKVKIAVGIVFLAAVFAAAGFYLTRPVEVETVFVTEGTLTESLRLEGTVAAKETNVVTATTNGIVTDILCRQGESVVEGAELVLVDDSAYQEEIADEIALLQKEKDSLYNRNYSSGLEISMRQQQLIDMINAAYHEYDMMFGENGTAYNDADAAKWAFETAKASYEAAADTNDDWEREKKQHPEADYGSAPFSGAQLAAYAGAMSEAKAAYENARQLSSEKNRLYYQNLIAVYQTQFDTLTKLGEYNANNAGQEKAKLQVSLDALLRKQTPDKMTAGKGGIVSELLVEEGSYVAQYQPLVRLYSTEETRLEVWMLPVSALVNEDQDTFVYQVEEGVCRKVPVAAGIYSGGMVKITDGPKAGAQVVVNPDAYSLKDGMKVKIK